MRGTADDNGAAGRRPAWASWAASGAWLAFAGLAAAVLLGHGGPILTDRALHAWASDHRPPVLVAAARVLTSTGTGVIPYVLVATAWLLAVRDRRRRVVAALLALVCLATGQAARYGVMALAGRARPPHQDWLTQASGWSFPSGHTTTSALTAGLVILAISVRAPRGRLPLYVAVACWGAGVGLTRILLGVHWSTDVLGGWLFAAGWLGVWLCTAGGLLPAHPEPGTGPRAESGDIPLVPATRAAHHRGSGTDRSAGPGH
ncbi:phosphatase PAP2 family protein [Streptomyces sp. NPDC005573]|uniref:phosphatase PAP2 family protein n=1 Tax=Streptomyces sp. NPDC005573 TaxID=3156890 RepID=UPI0033B4FB2C